jgi:nucleotide-binding universal stress UspA family protein
MKRFKNILCVMESEDACQSALVRAMTLAENNQATVTVATVTERLKLSSGMPGGGSVPPDLQDRVTAAQTQWLETLVEPYRERIEVNTLVLTGTPFLEIIRDVLRNGRDLVIKCPESPDWLERFLTGDDMHLLRKCPCPVWLVKPETSASYQRILAAVDVDDSYPPEELKTRQALNTMIMELAGSMAVSEFAELHVVHAWHAFAESTLRHSAFMSQPEDEVNAYVEEVQRHHGKHLDALMRETGAKLGPEAMEYLKPQLHLLKGWARQEIPALAKRLQVDCIVMGTVARTGVQGFFIGNTAETILEQIDCSVLAIKPPGFVTPVALED